MDWITENIAIGSYQDAENRHQLAKESIRSILGLTGALVGRTPSELGVERIEIVTLLDGLGLELDRFRIAVDLLGKLVAEAPPVLVHCRAGWSRSPAVVAAYLMQAQRISADKAV